MSKSQLKLPADFRKRVAELKSKVASAPKHIQAFREYIERELDYEVYGSEYNTLFNRYVELDAIIKAYPATEIESQISKNKKLNALFNQFNQL